jgi:hypothetical protein
MNMLRASKNPTVQLVRPDKIVAATDLSDGEGSPAWHTSLP